MREGESRGREIAGVAYRSAVLLIGALAFLPLADWIPIPPGTYIPPPFWALFLFWALGLVATGLLAWIGLKLIPWNLPIFQPRWWGSGGPWVLRWAPVLLFFVLPTLFASVTSREVFDAKPLHIDGMTQAFQARIFAGGRLNAPAPADSRFFSTLMTVEDEGRTFSHFPPGWAGLLALGVLIGLPWLMAPLCLGLAAYALFLLLREDGESAGGSFGAPLLLVLSPWVVFNAASWMNHVPAMAFLVLGSAALIRSIRDARSWPYAGLAAISLGLATSIRPLEGMAFGLPATVWVAFRTWRHRSQWRHLVAFAVGGTLSVGALLAYNWIQHGGPFLFGFDLQWGPGHGLGFHEAPWGPDHTPLRGFQLLNGYLLALQMYLYEAPVPALLPALTALLLNRRLSALDRYLLSASALIFLGYWAFWGEGSNLGPRYLIPLAPILAIWTARFGRSLGERRDSSVLSRWGNLSVLIMVISGWILGVPQRWEEYSESDPLRRVDAGVLTTPMVQNALVLVPSPWSSQVLARLRATGISRQRAQWLHDRIGLCRLDVAISSLERRGLTEPEQWEAALLPLTADSAAMVRNPVTGAPGDPFAGIGKAGEGAIELCRLRKSLEETKGGYLQLPFYAALGPTWTGDGPIVARDLTEENPRILAAYPDRRVFFLRMAGTRGTIRTLLPVPLNADSARAVWRAFDSIAARAEIF